MFLIPLSIVVLHLQILIMKSFNQLNVTASIWARDSHGLFDYESKSISKRQWRTKQVSFIKRTNDECELI